MTDPPDIKWLDPWKPESDEDGLLAKELRREVCDRHILFGVNVRAVGTRVDCDDVLFVTDDPRKTIAVVHLTWKFETDPTWPPQQRHDLLWMSPELAGASSEPKVVQGFADFHVRLPLISKFSGLGSDFGVNTPAIRPQSKRRGQRRRSLETTGHGEESCSSHHR